MNTNHLMLKDLLVVYHPETRGFVNKREVMLIKRMLCLNEMNITQLRNLRDFTVLFLGRSEKMADWDRMSAITYVIDIEISNLGGKV